METRRGRRSVIDLTAPSESPPEIPRPLIATAAIAPRRRLRDGSHSSRSSTATLSDVSGPSNTMLATGSRNRSTAIERRPNDRIRGRNESSSSASASGARRDVTNLNEGPRTKRARLSMNQSGEETTTQSAGSRAASRTSRPSESTSRGSASRAGAASVEDFDVDSSDEALVAATGQSSSGGVVPDSDEEGDKTDVMTVNTDLLDDLGNDIDQYQVVHDSSQESPPVPLRAIAREQEIDELADDDANNENRNEQDEEDDFEVVSHVKRSTDSSETQDLKRGSLEERGGIRKGKGKALVMVDPDEPPENLLASFGTLLEWNRFSCSLILSPSIPNRMSHLLHAAGPSCTHAMRSYQ